MALGDVIVPGGGLCVKEFCIGVAAAIVAGIVADVVPVIAAGAFAAAKPSFDGGGELGMAGTWPGTLPGVVAASMVSGCWAD